MKFFRYYCCRDGCLVVSRSNMSHLQNQRLIWRHGGKLRSPLCSLSKSTKKILFSFGREEDKNLHRYPVQPKGPPVSLTTIQDVQSAFLKERFDDYTILSFCCQPSLNFGLSKTFSCFSSAEDVGIGAFPKEAILANTHSISFIEQPLSTVTRLYE